MVIKWSFLFFHFLLLSVPTFAIDPWVGSKYLYSYSTEKEIVFKIEFSEDFQGRLLTRDGSSEIIYSADSGIINMRTLDFVGYTTYPFILPPGSTKYQQVAQDNRLLSLKLSGKEENTLLSETWQGCYQYQVGSQILKECFVHDDIMTDHLILSSELPSVTLPELSNQKILLPVHQSESVYLKLNSDSSVTLIDKDSRLTNFNVNRWEIENNELQLMTTLGTFIYKGIKNIEGVIRVILEVRSQNPRILMSALALDYEFDTTPLRSFDLVGDYKSSLVSTQVTHDLIYSFNENNFGGFETTHGQNLYFIPWTWEFKNNLIKAFRYSSNNNPLHSISELQSCISSYNCEISIQSSYKILNVKGSRYTLMRIMEYTPTEKRVEKNLSVWTFYKY